MRIDTIKKAGSGVGVWLLILLGAVSLWSLNLQRRTVAAEVRLQRLNLLAAEMRESSNELTALARGYVTSGDPRFRDLYYRVLEIRSGKRPRPEDYSPSDWRVQRDSGPGNRRPLLELLREEGVPEETFALLARSHDESELLAKLEIELMDGVAELLRLGKTALGDREHLIARMHDDAYHEAKRAIMLAASEFETAIRTEAFEEVSALQRRQRRYLLAAFVIIGVLLLGLLPLTIHVNRAILAPLGSLEEASDRMSRGDYSARAEVTTANELGQVASVFNQMASSIASEMARVEELRFALDNVPAYVYVKDRDSRYLYANKATLELFGCSSGELPGRSDGDFFPPDTVERLRDIDLRVLTGENTEEEVVATDSSGSQRVYHEVKTPLYEKSEDGEGETVVGLLGISTDITARKHAEERWRSLFESSPDAIILSSVDGRIHLVNGRTESLFGYTSDELIGQGVEKLLPEGLRGRHRRQRQNHSWSSERLPMEGRTNLTGRHRDGHEIRLAIGLSQIESRGARWTMAIAHDMTGHHLMSEKVRLLSTALEDAANGIAITDTQGVCQWVNPAFERITGYASEQIVGKPVSILKSGVHGDDFYRDLWTTILSGRSWHGEIHNRHRDGHVYIEEQLISPVHDDSGNVTHFVAVKQDVTERREMEQKIRTANASLQQQIAEIEALQAKLRDQAIRDPLTGLFNRRHLTAQLERHLERCRRKGCPISVILLDLDRFKAINDTHGHASGDAALSAVSELLLAGIRVSDTTGRWGGEEFVVMMPGAGLAAAVDRADALRAQCEKRVIEHNGTELRVTLSAGVAVFPDHGTDGDALLNAADQALYRAKMEGRNRVVAFDGRYAAS